MKYRADYLTATDDRGVTQPLPADTTAADAATNGYPAEPDPAVVPVGLDERKDG